MDILIGKGGCCLAVLTILLMNHAQGFKWWLRNLVNKRSLVVNYKGERYIIEG